MNIGDEIVEVLGRDPNTTGVHMKPGVVTDVTVFPPLIDITGDGIGVATPCVSGYRPIAGDFVQVLTDWNGKYSSVRVCLGRIAKLGALKLERAANQSATGGASVDISWDTEVLDQGYGFAPTATDVTLPAGSSGVFAITARAVGAGVWTTGSGLAIRAPQGTADYTFAWRNGSILAASITTALVAGQIIRLSLSNQGATQNFTAFCEITAVA